MCSSDLVREGGGEVALVMVFHVRLSERGEQADGAVVRTAGLMVFHVRYKWLAGWT